MAVVRPRAPGFCRVPSRWVLSVLRVCVRPASGASPGRRAPLLVSLRVMTPLNNASARNSMKRGSIGAGNHPASGGPTSSGSARARIGAGNHLLGQASNLPQCTVACPNARSIDCGRKPRRCAYCRNLSRCGAPDHCVSHRGATARLRPRSHRGVRVSALRAGVPLRDSDRLRTTWTPKKTEKPRAWQGISGEALPAARDPAWPVVPPCRLARTGWCPSVGAGPAPLRCAVSRARVGACANPWRSGGRPRLPARDLAREALRVLKTGGRAASRARLGGLAPGRACQSAVERRPAFPRGAAALTTN